MKLPNGSDLGTSDCVYGFIKYVLTGVHHFLPVL